MPLTLASVADLAGLPFDTLIDVRSPAEYAEDHLPGAINLPALSDDERARVGTIYKQRSPFEARRIGEPLVEACARVGLGHRPAIVPHRGTLPRPGAPRMHGWPRPGSRIPCSGG